MVTPARPRNLSRRDADGEAATGRHAKADRVAAAYCACFDHPQQLMIAEIGVGIAWASLLAMPYAIFASNRPQAKLGDYMGLFNIFIVVPQLLVAIVMGSIMKAWFPDQPIYTMGFASATMVVAALAMLRVKAAEATY